MQKKTVSRLPEMVRENEDKILKEWMRYQLAALGSKSEFVSEASLQGICAEFLRLFIEGLQTSVDTSHPTWRSVKEMLADLSAKRAIQGFTPSETATFVFSLKQPIFERLGKEIRDPADLNEEVWAVTSTLDSLGLYTTEVFQRSREEIIRRQQRELLELSTPVIRVWEKVVAVPIIGTLDSNRTQMIMESLLSQIIETGSKVAILDITGVPTVDTQTAQHLIKTVAAARLMGAECVISGIRPQIAQTIVHLGIDISDISTKASMADAVQESLRQLGWTLRKEQ